MSKCKYCGTDGGTHACNPKDVTVNMQKQDIAILRQGIADQAERVKVAVLMAKEYEQWIDFYHKGDGDYADFLKSKGIA